MNNRFINKSNDKLNNLFSILSVIFIFVGLGSFLLILGLKTPSSSVITLVVTFGAVFGVIDILTSIYIIKYRDDPLVFIKGAVVSFLPAMGVSFAPMVVFFFVLTKTDNKKVGAKAVIRTIFDDKTKVGDIVPFAGRNWIVLRKKGKDYVLFDYNGQNCEKYDDEIKVYQGMKSEYRTNSDYIGNDIHGARVYLRTNQVDFVSSYGTQGEKNWDNCHLRAWLNDRYLENYFSEEDRSKLLSIDEELGDKASLLNSEEFLTLNNKGVFALREEGAVVEAKYRFPWENSNENGIDKSSFWLLDKKHVTSKYEVEDYKAEENVQYKLVKPIIRVLK